MKAELDYELQVDDYVAFNLRYMESSDLGRRQLRNARVSLVLLTPAIVFAAIAFVFGDLTDGVLIALTTGVIMWFLTPRLVRREYRRNFGRMAKDPGIGVTGSHRLVADDYGITEITTDRSSSAAWAAIERVDETPDHVFVFFGPVQAFVIPRRIGDERVAAFLHVVRARVANREASV